MTKTARKPVLFSGIQPTGRLHVGNYLGALKNFVFLQNTGKYRCYFCIVDLHSLTENFDPKEKRGQILSLAADFIAAGISPQKSTSFLQSLVPAHAELTWVLNTLTPIGELERMTQYKDKTGRQKENVNAGLFDYPVLMAADIVLYNAKFVPVGDDQDQHLELARTLARRFNSKFGKTFTEPQALHTKTPRVMSLSDPAKKMSKSEPGGCLFIDDSPAEIEKKLKRAVTDSGTEVKFDEKGKPAISNLLGIYCALSGETVPALERKFHGRGYGEFKTSLAKVVADHFASFRTRKAALLKNPTALKEILAKGSAAAEAVANAKMREVRRKIGIALEPLSKYAG